MKITNRIPLLFFYFIFSFTIGGIPLLNAQTKSIFKETFEKKRVEKNWKIINGTWEVKDSLLQGTANAQWAIIISKKSLPENYILTFSALVEPETYLFEIMLNLHKEKFIGLLYNQLDKDIAFEDRSFYPNLKKENYYIRTTGNVGRLPSVDNSKEYKWCDWKIQKSGNKIFIWINNESIIRYDDTTYNILKAEGKFGFAINGKATIKNIQLYQTKGHDSESPKDFTPKKKERKPFFVFE